MGIAFGNASARLYVRSCLCLLFGVWNVLDCRPNDLLHFKGRCDAQPWKASADRSVWSDLGLGGCSDLGWEWLSSWIRL